MQETSQVQTRQYPLITVKSTMPGHVGLWEQHPDHPGGEVYISDDQLHQVAKTAKVTERLRNGILVQVEEEAGDAAT